MRGESSFDASHNFLKDRRKESHDDEWGDMDTSTGPQPKN